MRLLFLFIVILIASGGTAAQEATPDPDPMLTTAYRQAVVYAGPGETFVQVNLLNPGIEGRIIERNRIGTWVRVIREADDRVVMDGWVISGLLNLSPALRFSDIPVNTSLPDADPTTIPSQSMQTLYAVPVMPSISEAMREVYRRGQELGNNPRAVTKIGDSLSANPMYLTPMSQSEYDLGPYDYLEDTLRYFGPSTALDSVAARVGLGSYVVFDPMWADKQRCIPGETVLDCEYRLKQPSVALVMFGPNDVKHTNREEYTAQMGQIVEWMTGKGVIPVLSTFSYDPDGEFWWQAVELNLALVEIADAYDVPLVNLWAAARILPDYGLEVDHLHLKNSGFTYLKFSNGNESQYGVTLQNLLALRVLDEIRRTVIEG